MSRIYRFLKYRECIIVFTSILVLSTISLASVASPGLVLKLESVQDNYIIKEPIKFILTLENPSQDTLRIPGASEFQMSRSNHLYMEVIPPNGITQYRQCILVSTSGIINYNYAGEPLAPGTCIEMFRYPNISMTIPHAGSNSEAWKRGITFSEPGTYQVRYIYSVSPKFSNLWKNEDGELYSNSVTLIFHDPSPEEKEILDAIWGLEEIGYGARLSNGDDSTELVGNTNALQKVIDNYPSSSMIKYAYFYFGKQLLYGEKQDRASQAITIFKYLTEHVPDFRFEEVRQHLAVSFDRLGDHDQARQVFNEVIVKKPNIIHHYNFMRAMILVETGGNWKAIETWEKERMKGKYYPQLYDNN